MKVHSLTILHYGKDYLSYALRSVYQQVDFCHVFYTPTPSHGHQTDIPPIETKEELQAAAYAYDPESKIRWYDMLGVTQEGVQRDMALQTVQSAGAELVVVVDCDEIWPKGLLPLHLSDIWEKGTKRINLINMVHFWRSFSWACYDQGWPQRVLDLRFPPPKKYGDWHSLPENLGRVFHFGYATTEKVMNYKWQIHGHKGELRSEWVQGKWQKWPPPDDCHPTNDKGFWNPEPFDKWQLPTFMYNHPFFNLERIE